jgi:hypothetical protein
MQNFAVGVEAQSSEKLDERITEVKAHAPEHALISEPKLFEKPAADAESSGYPPARKINWSFAQQEPAV